MFKEQCPLSSDELGDLRKMQKSIAFSCPEVSAPIAYRRAKYLDRLLTWLEKNNIKEDENV